MKYGWLAIAVVTSACASTGAVPRPFPGGPVSPSRDPQAAAGSSNVEIDALVGTAMSLRGRPYRNGGSDPSGFDCSGFTQYVFAQYGIALPRDVREQFSHGRAVSEDALAPGDLLFFSTTDAGASHVAIVVDGNEFVHAPSSRGVVRVERLSSSYWSHRFVGARRVVESRTHE
jgi:peptidoglycan DL-endopeptidase CwlO